MKPLHRGGHRYLASVDQGETNNMHAGIPVRNLLNYMIHPAYTAHMANRAFTESVSYISGRQSTNYSNPMVY